MSGEHIEKALEHWHLHRLGLLAAAEAYDPEAIASEAGNAISPAVQPAPLATYTPSTPNDHGGQSHDS